MLITSTSYSCQHFQHVLLFLYFYINIKISIKNKKLLWITFVEIR